ncbi:uncharacterized protein Tco025E_03233 [Trypanosoma conorhini]|uniref:Uncharacterized protein n=1 Tax=Trypanosoma conorhini TaxID=83891 RepID=A0A422PW13_9TRYP|nr:uncharacterized protein Tco025E_03233 [Trypanosoma conorhini]RNF21903.1 hypothetical protein Tco025E_03233 [Trypanosoma conorhini]
MRSCICWTPVRPGGRRCASTDSPQSELHIPSPEPCVNGTLDGVRAGGVSTLMGGMSPNGIAGPACEPRATLTASAAGEELGGDRCNALGAANDGNTCSAGRSLSAAYKQEWKENRKAVECRYACASITSPQRAPGSPETFTTPLGLYTAFSGAAGPPLAMEQQQPRARSPLPERPDDGAPAPSSLRGMQQRLARRLQSPLPDDDGDNDVIVHCARAELMECGEGQEAEERDAGCGLGAPESRLGEGPQVSPGATEKNTMVPVPPKKQPAVRSPSPRFLAACSNPLQEAEATERVERGKLCSPAACPVPHSSGAGPTDVAAPGHRPAAEACEPRRRPPAAPDVEWPQEPAADALTVVDIAVSPDTSALELVDWHVLVEESVTLDLTVGSEGTEEALPPPARGFEGPPLPTTAACGREHNVDNAPSLPTPTAAAEEEEEATRLHSQSPQRRDATRPPPSARSDSVASPRSWPPSIHPIDNSSFEKACDEEDFEVLRRESALKSLLARLAVNKDHHIHGGGSGEVRGKASPPPPSPPSPPPRAEVRGAFVPQDETPQFELAPLLLVVELCRALRPFARRLLLLLVQESGGGASVACEACAELANSILEEEGVRRVRATRHLCRSIAALGGSDAAEGDMLPYSIFLTGVLQLAGDA